MVDGPWGSDGDSPDRDRLQVLLRPPRPVLVGYIDGCDIEAGGERSLRPVAVERVGEEDPQRHVALLDRRRAEIVSDREGQVGLRGADVYGGVVLHAGELRARRVAPPSYPNMSFTRSKRFRSSCSSSP